MNTLNKQAGIAVITAVFIVSLITVLAIIVIMQQRLDIYRTRQMIIAEQSYLYAQGIIDWAKGVLQEDAKNPDKKKDEWFKILPITQIPHGSLQAILIDYSNRLNINAINAGNNHVAFVKLIKKLNLLSSAEDTEKLINNIYNWITPLSSTTLGDPLMVLYLSKKPPYRAAHRPMQSISELRLVDGITPTIYNKLQPYLAALPMEEKSTNEKSFFLLQSEIVLENQNLTLYALLERQIFQNGITIKIVWQSIGTI